MKSTNSPLSILHQSFDEHQSAIELVRHHLIEELVAVGEKMASVLHCGGTIYWCGNGGSAADSQHLAAELVGRFKGDRRALRSVAISADSSILTCVGNDYGFSRVFSRQIEALGHAGDLLVAISTSGNSENVVTGLESARFLGLHTVGLFGNEGGKARCLVDHAIVVPSITTARIQEAHILIGHCLCDLIEHNLGIA